MTLALLITAVLWALFFALVYIAIIKLVSPELQPLSLLLLTAVLLVVVIDLATGSVGLPRIR